MPLMIGGDYVKGLFYNGNEYTKAVLNNEVIYEKESKLIIIKQGTLDASKGDVWTLYFKTEGLVQVSNKGDLLLAHEYVQGSTSPIKRDVPYNYGMVIGSGSYLKLFPEKGVSNVTVSISETR